MENNGITTPWVKATASVNGGHCVELRRVGADIQVRDSKNPDSAVLHFTPEEFRAFQDGVRKHEFDHLA